MSQRQPGQRRATRADVADAAGVSKTTVTYVLADRYDIAIPESTRARVRAVAERLGYHPHPAAKALASGRTNSITVAVPVRIGPYYARVLQAFERQTNAHGYHMIASTIGHVNADNVLPDLWALLNELNDGIVLVDMPSEFQPYIDELLPAAKPIVSMGVFTVEKIDSVENDLSGGATAALEQLLAADPRRVAYFGPAPGGGEGSAATAMAAAVVAFAGDPRVAAYHAAMETAGRPLEIVAGDPNDRYASMASLHAHIDAHGCPDALFCFNDEIAISAYRALRERGLRVPDNVCVVGCDGSEEGEFADPALSTIVQPVDRMCALAWELLTGRLQDPLRPLQHARVRSEFVVRGSSPRANAARSG